MQRFDTTYLEVRKEQLWEVEKPLKKMMIVGVTLIYLGSHAIDGSRAMC